MREASKMFRQRREEPFASIIWARFVAIAIKLVHFGVDLFAEFGLFGGLVNAVKGNAFLETLLYAS